MSVAPFAPMAFQVFDRRQLLFPSIVISRCRDDEVNYLLEGVLARAGIAHRGTAVGVLRPRNGVGDVDERGGQEWHPAVMASRLGVQVQSLVVVTVPGESVHDDARGH